MADARLPAARRLKRLALEAVSDVRDLVRRIEERLRACEDQCPGDTVEKVAALRKVAETCLKVRLPAKAIPIYERMLAILKAIESQPSAERLATLDALSTAYAACGRHHDCLPPIEEAIAILTAHFPEQTADLYSAMSNLASAHLGLEQYDLAERIFLECLSLSDTVLKARKESIAATHHQLGALYFQKGDYLQSEKSLSAALTLKKRLFGDSHPQVGMTLNNLAAVYTLLGHPRAARMAEEARQMLEARMPPPRPTRAVSVRCLDSGGRAVDLVGPFLGEIGRSGFVVERVFTVGAGDIYEESILPPIVTVYFHQADLADAADLTPLALSMAAVLARFRAAGLGGGADQKLTNDAGVFVHWNDEATVRYYFVGESYTPSAFTTIPSTFANVAPRIQRKGHSLRNIALWTDEHWRWLQPGGGDSRVD